MEKGIAGDQSRCNNALLKYMFTPSFVFSVQLRRDYLSVNRLAFSRRTRRFLDRTINALWFQLNPRWFLIWQIWYRRRPCLHCHPARITGAVGIIRSMIYWAEEISGKLELQDPPRMHALKPRLSSPRGVLWHVDFERANVNCFSLRRYIWRYAWLIPFRCTIRFRHTLVISVTIAASPRGSIVSCNK